MLRFGYACLTLGVPGTQMRSCIMRTATEAHLREVISHNLEALKHLVQYNKNNNIRLFRISSDLIPFGSSPVNTLSWQELFADTFDEIGSAIATAGLRASLHPGQYTVINSPRVDVVDRAIADLEYHESILRLLKCDNTSKLILHVGGAYGDKEAAIERFCQNWERLSSRVQSRVVLENDDRIFTAADVLTISERLSIPAVFDVLHHEINPPEESKSLDYWITQFTKTWKPADGRQKIHYSQQRSGGKPGAHSETIYSQEFLRFYKTVCTIDLDIMLEVKDKNLSTIKCELIASKTKRISSLEVEWARYKYNVLERSPSAYHEIRQLLKDKNEYPVMQFYCLLEQAMDTPIETSKAVNALLHVWGYFKGSANPHEKARFFSQLAKYNGGTIKVDSLKKQLYGLAIKYNTRYLLESYYLLLSSSK